MKALTVCQPYADMIATGEKIIENRTWPAPKSLIGKRFAIHAGKSRAWMDDTDAEKRPGMSFGAVVATAKLVDCVMRKNLPIELVERHDANGPWCWILSDIEALRPIPARGAQGVWDWEQC